MLEGREPSHPHPPVVATRFITLREEAWLGGKRGGKEGPARRQQVQEEPSSPIDGTLMRGLSCPSLVEAWASRGKASRGDGSVVAAAGPPLRR